MGSIVFNKQLVARKLRQLEKEKKTKIRGGLFGKSSVSTPVTVPIVYVRVRSTVSDNIIDGGDSSSIPSGIAVDGGLSDFIYIGIPIIDGGLA